MPLENKRIVYLVGFMGVGKSTVGRCLADHLNCSFFDTDEEVELVSGQQIRQIFEEQGELAFRGLESQALKEVSCQECSVVSTGGGVVGRPDNWQIMNRTGVVVYLYADWATIESRLLDTTQRPLAQNGTDEKLHQLWQTRQPLYQQADKVIITDRLNPQQVVEQILLALHIE